MELVGKRGMADLGSRINHVSGSKMSEWAKKMLMKQGWSEGKGLGKNEDGIKNYVKVRSKHGTACMERGGVCMGVVCPDFLPFLYPGKSAARLVVGHGLRCVGVCFDGRAH